MIQRPAKTCNGSCRACSMSATTKPIASNPARIRKIVVRTAVERFALLVVPLRCPRSFSRARRCCRSDCKVKRPRRHHPRTFRAVAFSRSTRPRKCRARLLRTNGKWRHTPYVRAEEAKLRRPKRPAPTSVAHYVVAVTKLGGYLARDKWRHTPCAPSDQYR